MSTPLYVKGQDPKFDLCLPFILKEEGGNSQDPRDPGGRTSRGVIQKEWNAFLLEHSDMEMPTDVWKAPDVAIHDIYYRGTKEDHYWLPRCPTLHPGVDLCYFNIAVNCGHGTADRILMHSIGGDDPSTVNRMMDLLATYYRGLKTFKTFGKGWLARTERCRTAALAMVGKEIPMTTVTPTPTVAPATPTPAAPKVDIIMEIEGFVETADKFLPTVAAFFPPLQPVLPFLPILEGLLKMVDELQQSDGNAQNIAAIVASHLHAVATNLEQGFKLPNLNLPNIASAANAGGIGALLKGLANAAPPPGQPQGGG